MKVMCRLVLGKICHVSFKIRKVYLNPNSIYCINVFNHAHLKIYLFRKLAVQAVMVIPLAVIYFLTLKEEI